MIRRRVSTRHHYRYTVIFEPLSEGGYVVTCPTLPGVVTQGETIEEARSLAADAIRIYLGALRKGGARLPAEDYPPLVEQIEIAVEPA